jgi:hypothetical protein
MDRFVERDTRRVHLRHIIQFGGIDYEIAPTSRKSATALFHPRRKLWVLEHSPNLTWPPILGHFTLQSVRFCSVAHTPPLNPCQPCAPG